MISVLIYGVYDFQWPTGAEKSGPKRSPIQSHLVGYRVVTTTAIG